MICSGTSTPETERLQEQLEREECEQALDAIDGTYFDLADPEIRSYIEGQVGHSCR